MNLQEAEDAISNLETRCNHLEAVILDLMSIIIDNKVFDLADYPNNMADDTQLLKETFEKLIEDY